MLTERRSKGRQNKGSVSLIPVIERQEEQLRKELQQARRDAESQIRRAKEQAEQRLGQSRRNLSELIEQTRKERLTELHGHAEQLSRSSEARRAHLRRQKEKNMARAVQRLVDVVAAAGGRT